MTESKAVVTAVINMIEAVVDARVAVALENRTEEASSPWLSVREAAAYVRASERTIERLVTSNRIPSTTLGRRRLLHRNDLDNFLRARS